jgi:hypothetical protein
MMEFMQQTEQWLMEECGAQLGFLPGPDQVWEAVKDFSFDVMQLKRWFGYLSTTGAISKQFSIDVFSLPRLDSFESEDLIVLYEDRILVSGLGVQQFTAGGHCWSLEGVERFFTLLQLGEAQAYASSDIDDMDQELSAEEEDEEIIVTEAEAEPAVDEAEPAISVDALGWITELQEHIGEGLQKIDQSVEESMKLHTVAPVESKRLIKLLLAAETELEQARMLITQPENEV